MGSILPTTPFDLVDLFFNFQGLQVIEFGFMRLELGVEFVFAGFLLFQESTLQSESIIENVPYRFVSFE